MKIENKVVTDSDYLSPVTYIPQHAKDAGHPDCERGVIISFTDTVVKVLYCNSRTLQTTETDLLLWG